jgi:hypothetical protein
MNGISISPLPQADTASAQNRAFTASKGNVEGLVETVKAHWAQALKAFSDRLDYRRSLPGA